MTNSKRAVRAGKINPFGPSILSCRPRSMIDELRIKVAATQVDRYNSKGVATSIDGKVTESLDEPRRRRAWRLAAGFESCAARQTDLHAVGPAAVSNNIAGDRRASLPPWSAGRPPWRAHQPLARQPPRALPVRRIERAVHKTDRECSLRLRHDHYSEHGLHHQSESWACAGNRPSKTVVLRGSAGTGFRAHLRCRT